MFALRFLLFFSQYHLLFCLLQLYSLWLALRQQTKVVSNFETYLKKIVVLKIGNGWV